MARVVLVTGASAGIGRQIAALLARRGYRVFGTSRQPAADQLDGFELLPLDVTSDESVSACIAAVLERAGHIDVLVNNAGVELLGAVEDIDMDEAKWIFETNFFGVLRMTRAVLPHLREQHSGVIINISSLAGLAGAPFQGLYAASKHALEGLTESLWYELQPLNIRVALVEPGFFKSEIGQRKRLPAQSTPDYAPERERVVARWNALLEGGSDPAPVARTVLRIADGRSRRLRHFVGQGTRSVWLKYVVPEWLVHQRVRSMFGLDSHAVEIERGLLAVLGVLALAGAALLRRTRNSSEDSGQHQK